MRKAKCLVGLLVVLCMVVGLIPAAYAQDPSYVKLKGIYETFQNLSFGTDGDITSIEWLQSDTQAGTYSVISGATGNTFYTGGAADGSVVSPYAGKWIKVRINGSVESEPRQIGPALGRQEDITGGNAKKYTGVGTTYADADITPVINDMMYAFPSGVKATTPSDYVFNVDGMDFVLLDDTESDESRFLVLTKIPFGSQKFDTVGGQLFDPTRTSNIAYWLNDSTSGYLAGGTDGNGANILPGSILSHINKNQTWKIETMMFAHNHTYKYERAATCGLVLPALYELKKYYEKIGFHDIDIGWWTRTPQGITGTNTTGDGSSVLGTTTGSSNVGKFFGRVGVNVSIAVRPMFYLSKDFFIDKVVDLSKAGVGVKSILRRNYTQNQLIAAGYNTADIELMYSNCTACTAYVSMFDASGQILPNMNTSTVKAIVDIESAGLLTNSMAVLAVYNGQNSLIGLKTMPIDAENTKLTFILTGLVPSSSNYAKVFLWDGLSSMVPRAVKKKFPIN